MIGERIGAYTVIEQIGEGGMGTVWMGKHAKLGRRAAIKMLHANMSANREATTRFFNEAKAAAAIQDAGIVQIFDFGEHDDGRAYIVMELLEGESLDRRLNRLGKMPAADALRIMRQVASSLGAAHAGGIVHRDLKPDNVFLVKDSEVQGGERAKLLDFGIAKIANDSSLKTATALVMGTPSFMSPEQCRGAGKVDQRSDVYSLGCMLFTLLTGRPPFEAEGPGDIIAMHLREAPPVPSTLEPSVPHSVDALVRRCMEKDPALRYASGREVADAIAEIRTAPYPSSRRDALPAGDHAAQARAHSTTLTSYSQIASERQLGKTLRGRGTWRLALAAVGILIAGAIALGARRDSSSDAAPEVAAPPQVAEAQPPTSPAPLLDAAPRPARDPAPAPAPEKAPTPTPAKAPSADGVAAPKTAAAAKLGQRPAPAPRAPPKEETTEDFVDCVAQFAALESFVKTHPKMRDEEKVRAAMTLGTDCFDRKDKIRLSSIAVEAACRLDLRKVVLRFYNLAESALLRARCPKFLAEDEGS